MDVRKDSSQASWLGLPRSGPFHWDVEDVFQANLGDAIFHKIHQPLGVLGVNGSTLPSGQQCRHHSPGALAFPRRGATLELQELMADKQVFAAGKRADLMTVAMTTTIV